MSVSQVEDGVWAVICIEFAPSGFVDLHTCARVLDGLVTMLEAPLVFVRLGAT